MAQSPVQVCFSYPCTQKQLLHCLRGSFSLTPTWHKFFCQVAADTFRQFCCCSFLELKPGRLKHTLSYKSCSVLQILQVLCISTNVRTSLFMSHLQSLGNIRVAVGQQRRDLAHMTATETQGYNNDIPTMALGEGPSNLH